nr:hypothetical protein [Tanacetum cinerariifolium]
YVAESDPEEDPEVYKEDETEDGQVDYPLDGGDDGDDDDGDSSGYDANDEDEDGEDEEAEKEHLASADSTVVIPIDEIRERLARYMAPAALPSPLLPPSLYPSPPVDHRDGIPESKHPPRKRLCLSTLGSRYEVGESSTRGRGVDYGFVDTVEAEMRHRGIGEVGYGIRDTWIDPAEAVPEMAPTTLEKDDSLGDSMDHGGGGLCYLRGLGSFSKIVETLRVMRDIRQEMGDMQAELLALRGQPRRVGQSGGDVRVPNHQDTLRDADSHI